EVHDDGIERSFLELQVLGVTFAKLQPGIGVTSGGDHRRREINSNGIAASAMSQSGRVSRATCHVEQSHTWCSTDGLQQRFNSLDGDAAKAGPILCGRSLPPLVFKF